MKFIKISLLVLLVGSLSSCLKSVNDFGGTRTDSGGVLTAITETEYISADAQNIGYGWSVFTNFSFTQIPGEAVKFFTLHISQPRSTKMSGAMTVKVAMTALAGYTAPPAGAVTITDIVIPASSALAFDVPVKFVVNKALFNVANWYGATFTITSVSQGQFAANESSVDVIFNNYSAFNTSKYTGRFIATTSVLDAANVYGVDDNTRFYALAEGNYFTSTFVANRIHTVDLIKYAFGNANRDMVMANNMATGAQTAIVPVAYVLDATGKVIDVLNSRTLVSLAPTFDASHPNSFVYTDNDHRVLDVKYTVSLTLNALTRNFTITDKYTYDPTQALY